MTDDDKIDFLKKHKGKKCYMWDNEKPNKPNRYLNGIRLNCDYPFIDNITTYWRNCEVEEEPTYSEYTQQTIPKPCMVKKKHSHEIINSEYVVCEFNQKGVVIDRTFYSYGILFRDWVHLDESPCGVKV